MTAPAPAPMAAPSPAPPEEAAAAAPSAAPNKAPAKNPVNNGQKPLQADISVSSCLESEEPPLPGTKVVSLAHAESRTAGMTAPTTILRRIGHIVKVSRAGSNSLREKNYTLLRRSWPAKRTKGELACHSTN